MMAAPTPSIEGPAMISSPNATVAVAVADAICTITLDRPERLNAIDRDMAQALGAVTAAAAEDAAIRAVVVRGAGDHFMAGGDLAFFKTWLDEATDRSAQRDRFEGFVREVHPSIMALRDMRKPVIAGVQGAVAGFGVSLMLACDLVVASDDATFTLAYSLIGTSPDGSSTHSLPRIVGLKRAFEIALLADRFGAAEAREWGLINRVVPAAELDGAVAELAGRLAAGPTHAYGNTKALLNATFDRPLEDQLDAEAASFADCAVTDDFAEGIAAFLAKRSPKFEGR
jgi:2-(1,2-epoxy-1,2-dihydrophenyl)acetyl-CoA isomerase